MVFDLGGVLIDWDPRHLYRNLVPVPDRMERFLSHVCTQEWIARLDRGRPWADAVSELCSRFPEHRDLIEAFDWRWQETVAGPIQANVAVLCELLARQVDVVALTNWSAVKLHELARRPGFGFLGQLRKIVISSDVGMTKPHPEIFAVAERAFERQPHQLILIDDNEANALAARRRGWDAIWFRATDDLRGSLVDRRVLPLGSSGGPEHGSAPAEGGA